MPDVEPDLPVYDIGDLSGHDGSSSSGPGPVSDTVEFGGSPRVSGLLVLGVVGVATVAAIVLIANHANGRRAATPTLPPNVTALPSPTPPTVVAVTPAAPAAALVEGRTTCFDDEPGRGETISFGIRNRLSRAVVVQRVSFAAQRGATVAATSIGINHRSPSTCPEPRDLRPAARYRLAPGPVWISVRLTRTPACGTELRSTWLVSFTDRGETHQVRFTGPGITPNCPPRAHFSHGRSG